MSVLVLAAEGLAVERLDNDEVIAAMLLRQSTPLPLPQTFYTFMTTIAMTALAHANIIPCSLQLCSPDRVASVRSTGPGTAGMGKTT